MTEPGIKRKHDPSDAGDRAAKKSKGKKQWRTPRGIQTPQIEPGDSGIFATCDMKKESKCVGELRDLFDEYADQLYGANDEEIPQQEGKPRDIATDIANELEQLKSKRSKGLFTNIKLDIECVVFIKTRDPVQPESFVHHICKEAAASNRIHSRFVRKLTPMTLMGKATEKGLEETAKKVLAPHFHLDNQGTRKFAIRPNFRNHTVLKRDDVIKKVAAAVGPRHEVDLKNYDLLILVEVYQSILGMSVVERDYDKLKKFNLAELAQPVPKDDA